MQILVVGGAGFIGTHLAERLKADGHNVYAYDFALGDDVFNLKSLCAHVRQYDVIVHLVGLPDAHTAQRDPMQSFELNVRSLAYALEALRMCGDTRKRILWPSSAAVYGVTEEVPVGENTEPHPANIYAWHKMAGEVLIRAYTSEYGIPHTIFRLFNVYGKGSKGIINTLVEKAKAQAHEGSDGKPYVMYGAGQIRDFVHTSDVVEAFRLAIVKDEAKNRTINIGSGQGVFIGNIAAMVQRIYPEFKMEVGESKAKEYNSVADIKLARALLGYEPKVGWGQMEEVVKRELC
jgi:nucleoside-diphosphate-sugar epimerase